MSGNETHGSTGMRGESGLIPLLSPPLTLLVVPNPGHRPQPSSGMVEGVANGGRSLQRLLFLFLVVQEFVPEEGPGGVTKGNKYLKGLG